MLDRHGRGHRMLAGMDSFLRYRSLACTSMAKRQRKVRDQALDH